ncbi:uncharacterized protein LOC131432767 isoform X2 [Malaya genurostris]|uniref:uncharacterized protein LOC131432767 isoform X2 n=1 Tax=Malaya genurostris TaxID=325434 RepID=UPI0026F3848E|nr:uncharacterized protein LOC131432767 isoform X2 [Malaya genurostris]
MNFFTISIVLGLSALCQAGYTEKQTQSLNFIIGECAKEQGIELNSDFTEQWKYTGDLFPDEEKSKQFAVCLDHKMGVLGADGTIESQVLIDFLAEGHDVQPLTELVQHCAESDGDSAEDRLYEFYKCFWAEITFEL